MKNLLIGSNRYVTFELNDRIGPIDRALVYEEPIDEYLKAHGFGEVVGGGTYQLETGEIKSCDVQVELSSHGNNRVSINSILEKFIELGAPKGSKMVFDDRKGETAFGNLEGMAIYLDGQNLSPEVYAENNINDLITELNNRLEYTGIAGRNWQGQDSTALYYYGPSYNAMLEEIQSLLDTHPLCSGSRIQQIS